VGFDNWCACLIGDNAAENVRAAALCGKPHVGCKNHKPSLDVNMMFKEDQQLNSTIENIRVLMLTIKTMKSSAALRNLTDIRRSLFMPISWSGKYYVF
jgi:hypothetical protein